MLYSSCFDIFTVLVTGYPIISEGKNTRLIILLDMQDDYIYSTYKYKYIQLCIYQSLNCPKANITPLWWTVSVNQWWVHYIRADGHHIPTGPKEDKNCRGDTVSAMIKKIP